MQELQRKRDKPIFTLYKLLSDDGAMELAEKVTGEDEEIRVVKELSAGLLEEHTKSKRRALQDAFLSRMPESAAISVCSSQDSLTNSSVRSIRIRKSVKEGESNKKNVQLQTDDLRTRFSDLQEKYDNQKKVCKKLIFNNNPTASGFEIQKLEKSYQTMAAAAVRLREQLPSVEADDMDLQIDQEEAEVFEVKAQIVRLMTREGGLDGGKDSKREIIVHKEGDKEDEEEETDRTAKMKREMERLKTRLDNQKELIDDVLLTKDLEMIKRELLTLDKVYDDYVIAVVHLRDEVSAHEAERLSMLIATEDSSVFMKKKLASRAILQNTDINETRKRSDSVSRAEDVIKPVGEAKDKARAQEDESHLKELEKARDAGEKGIDVKESGLETEVKNPKVKEEYGMGGLMELNKLMVQTMKLYAAPKVEIDIFRGDPIEYSYFIESFRDVVEALVDNPKQRLIRLLKYTEGDAKDLIKHCVHEDAETCYDTAVSLLEKEYGNPFTISCAYLEKLRSWPQIKANDGVGLKGLYRFLLRCLSYQKKGSIDLNSPITIRSVQLALPVKMQDSWTTRVGKIRKKSKVEATFANFVEFVEEWCQTLTDPVYARGGLKDKNERLKVFLTDLEQKTKGMIGKKM